MKRVSVVAVLTLSMWGCTLNDAEAEAGADMASEMSLDLGSRAEWLGATTSGIEVIVRPDRLPIRVGPTVFQISFEQDIPDDIPVSIDVISPEMPVMGLMRYMAERSGPNTYTASAEIRMDGAWEIYVNLGDGTDAAPFAFDVQPGASPDESQHDMESHGDAERQSQAESHGDHSQHGNE